MVSEIFRCLLPHEGDNEEQTRLRLVYAKWLFNRVPLSEWVLEDFIIAYYIKYAASLDILLDSDYFFSLMDLTLRGVIKKNSVKINGTQLLDLNDYIALAEAERKTKDTVLGEYQLLMELPGHEPVNFLREVDTYFKSIKKDRFYRALNESGNIEARGASKLIGVNDAMSFLVTELSKIEALYGEESLSLLRDSIGQAMATDLDEVLGYLGIAPIDKDMRGCIRGKFLGLEAGPGVGKTRFAIGTVMYNLAVVHKRDVSYYALEPSKKEVESILISHHIFMKSGCKIRIPDIEIMTLKMDEKRQELIDVARYELFSSGKYGKMHIIEGDLHANIISEEMDVHDNLFGPFDVEIVDYMYVLKWKKGNEYEREGDQNAIIAAGYRGLAKRAKRKMKFIVGINQLNDIGQEAVEHDKVPPMKGAAGGQEVYRSTDYNIALGANEALQAQRKRRLFIVKKRFSEGTGIITANVLLDVAYYYIPSN